MRTALCQLFCPGRNQYWQKGQTIVLRWYLFSYLSFSPLPSCSQTTLKLVNHSEHICEADVTRRRLKAKAGAKVALLTLEGAFSCVPLPPIPTPTQPKGASICFIFRWSNFWDHKANEADRWYKSTDFFFLKLPLEKKNYCGVGGYTFCWSVMFLRRIFLCWPEANNR